MNKPDSRKNRQSENATLIFDRDGALGQAMVAELAKESFCVFVSHSVPELPENCIHIRLTKRVPRVPKGTYRSIFLNFNNDRIVLDLLPVFVEQAREDNAHIYFILNIRQASETLIAQILAFSPRITILLTGDMFHHTFDWHNPVTDLIKQGRSGKLILKESLSPVYPVELTDVLSVIERVSHIKGIPGHRVLYLLPPHQVTMLSLARLLCKKEPLLKLDIKIPSGNESQDYQPGTYFSAFGPVYDLAAKLPIIRIEPLDGKSKPTRRKRFRVQLPFRSFIYTLIFSLVLTVFALPVVSALMGAGFLARTQLYVNRGEFEGARASVNAARIFFAFSERSASGIRLLSSVGMGSYVRNIDMGIRTGKTISETVISGIDGMVALKKVFQGLSLDPKRDLLYSLQNLKQVAVQVSLLQVEGSIPQAFKKQADKVEKLNSITNALFEVMPHLLGMDGKQTYLVLFQNNMELRPGGGFIGSYGILQIDKGKITDFPIRDVYDADGQLSEHIEPPFQLRRYLGVSHWFLRDSNFDIDFSRNGASAAFFYHAETKETVDGVIAIDTSFIKKLLEAVGPVKVAGYNETVTADNFFMLTESYAQDNFFPGSRQKQDFLKAVAVSLFARLTQTKNIDYLALAEVTADSVSEKHLLFAFPDKNIQRIFSLQGGASSVLDARTEKEGVFNDFLGVNDANLGMNKVNYYIDRSISHEVKLGSDGSATGKVTVHYLNKSTKFDKYGGDYKSYTRFILPAGTELQSVVFDGILQDIKPAVTDPSIFTAFGYTPQSGLEVERTEADGKTVYGFLHIVPVEKKKTITVSYTVQTKAAASQPEIVYALRVFKQPGTEADPYVFSFTYPVGFKVLGTAKELRTNNSQASLLTTLSEDKDIFINLGKR